MLLSGHFFLGEKRTPRCGNKLALLSRFPYLSRSTTVTEGKMIRKQSKLAVMVQDSDRLQHSSTVIEVRSDGTKFVVFALQIQK